MARVQSDIARIDAKLANPDFIARAPEDVVEGEREKREEADAGRRSSRRWSGSKAHLTILSRLGREHTTRTANAAAGRTMRNSWIGSASSGSLEWACD